MVEHMSIDGDPMDHALRATARELADRAHARGLWDQAPELNVMIRTGEQTMLDLLEESTLDETERDQVRDAITDDQAVAFAVTCRALDIPEPMWFGPLPEVITDIANAIASGPLPPAPGTVFAVALVSEGWAHAIDDPDAPPQEIRVVTALDITGAVHRVVEFRGREPETVQDTLYGDAALVLSLDHFLQAITTVDDPSPSAP